MAWLSFIELDKAVVHVNFQMFKLVVAKAEESEIKLSAPAGS